MKIYREPIYKYLVINHGRFFFRIGYKLRRWHFGTCRYAGNSMIVLSLWVAGLFLQVDWDKKE